MTLSQFNALDEMEQALVVCKGVHIAHRQDDEYRILLYSIDSFYVEVFHNKKHSMITKFRSFSSTDLLMPYLEGIDITGLVK